MQKLLFKMVLPIVLVGGLLAGCGKRLAEQLNEITSRFQ